MPGAVPVPGPGAPALPPPLPIPVLPGPDVEGVGPFSAARHFSFSSPFNFAHEASGCGALRDIGGLLPRLVPGVEGDVASPTCASAAPAKQKIKRAGA
jgi:hypothetical protein